MDPYLGEIRMVCFNFVPTGWAACNGQMMSIAQNSALFSLLGTQFGGDGQRTFGLPDLRGRVPINNGQGPGLATYEIGEAGGVENATLLPTNMPMHTHPVQCSNAPGTASNPTGAVWAEVNTGGREPVVSPAYTTGAATGQMAPNAIGIAGGSLPFSVQQPFLAVNFILAVTGIYPSRP